MKKVIQGVDARNKVKEGIDAVADAVKVTLGARGRTVIIADEMKLVITKDGVTVARSVEVDDVLANVGASMMKEVANKTVAVVGDGTTTATILAQAIVTEGMKYVIAGANPTDIKRGIDGAVQFVIDDIAASANKVDDTMELLKTIATVSANGDTEVGRLIFEAYQKIGKEGMLVVEESESVETYIDVIEGLQFERGYISPHFVTNPNKMEVELKKPYILISDIKISKLEDILKLMERVAKESRPLLVIASDVDGQALTGLVINKQRGALISAAVKAPYSGERGTEFLRDLAILTGGKVIEESTNGFKNKDLFESLGICDSVLVTKDRTVIVGSGGDEEKIKEHTEGVTSQKESSQHDAEKKYLEERLARLRGGIGVFYVGAPTSTEANERKDRIDDAVRATKCAIEEGVVAGGGVAYLLASRKITQHEDTNIPYGQRIGWQIVKNAILSPIKQLLFNSGVEDGSRIIMNIEEKQAVYNVALSEYTPIEENKIIDPAKVVRVALENAASIAGMFLTTECLVYNREDRRQKSEVL